MKLQNNIDLALMLRGKKMRWLTEQLGVSKQQAYKLRKSPDPRWSSIEKLARIFNMKPSEFVRLGEAIDGGHEDEHAVG